MNTFSERGAVILPHFCSAESADLLAEEIHLYRDVPHLAALRSKVDAPSRGETFAMFGLYDAALRYWMPRIEGIVGEALVPVNSYGRIYMNGSTLAAHSDLPFLEIGVSLCLRRGTSDWPFCVLDRLGNEMSFTQAAGDAVIYDGTRPHWRNGPFSGGEQTQVFLHYCRVSGPYSVTHRYRQRKHLGIQLPVETGPFDTLVRQLLRPFRTLLR